MHALSTKLDFKSFYPFSFKMEYCRPKVQELFSSLIIIDQLFLIADENGHLHNVSFPIQVHPCKNVPPPYRFYELSAHKIHYFTSVMLSRILPIVSLLFNFAFSMASSLTSTASIFETMLPMECSIRSTRLDSTVNSS